MLRALSASVVLLWAVANIMLGVSLSYLCRCMYLELVLHVKSLTRGPDCKPIVKSKANKDAPAAAKGKTATPTAPALRGVTVVAPANGHTSPPSKRISALFADGAMPTGEELDYQLRKSFWSQHLRFGRAPRSDVAISEDDAWCHRVQCLREGAEVHRQVRQHVQRRLRPGLEVREIAAMVEEASSTLVGFDPKHPLRRGWAFPTGISLNEVAAHDTPNPGDASRRLLATDIVKLDFGVHVEGHILDCAFTFAFDPVHDELMQAVKEATNEGLRWVGPDAVTSEIGARIAEVMEAAEVHSADGKVLPVKAIKNLTGHSIGPYKIHNGKSLPSCNTGSSARMQAGEVWAVETFGSVGGVGYVVNRGDCSHFMRPSASPPRSWQTAALSDSAKDLLELIDWRFSTLAFCPRWLVQEATRIKSPLLKAGGGASSWWRKPLNELSSIGVVQQYPPMAEAYGAYTAQYEHTVLLGPRGKEILTRGEDY